MKRTLSALLALVMVCSLLPVPALGAETLPPTGEITQPPEAMGTIRMTWQREPIVVDGQALTGEDLFAAYADSVFYGRPLMPLSTGSETAGARLKGDEALAYQALVPIIQEIAAGDRDSAIIALSPVSPDVQVDFRESYLHFNADAVFDALWYDLAYEMYWCWSVADCDVTPIDAEDPTQYEARFYIAVEPKFRITPTGYYQVNTALTAGARTAARNARAIVSKYDGLPDYDKLLGYKEEICALNSYNYDATQGNYAYKDYGPWQIIYIFDQDPETNVVCGGYAKAFQYLCDLGGLTCYYVLGYIPGYHAWNIVTLMGKNYLVDVTNSEPNYWGDDGSLFLAGGTGSVDSGYTIRNRYGNTMTYRYQLEEKDPNDPDEKVTNMLDTWGSKILTLSATSYVPCDPHVYTAQVTKDATCAAEGTETHTCTGCGHRYTTSLAKTAHSYDGGRVTVGPTCYFPGERTYVCSGCGGTKTQEIPMTAHTYGEGTVTREPEGEAPGIRTYACTVCGSTDDREFFWAEGLERLSGADRCATARKTADALKDLSDGTFPAILYASGDSFADALAGSFLAVQKSAPILLYRERGREENLAYIQSNLEEDGVVYLLGGTAAVPAQVEAELMAAGIQTVRLSGATRYETNLRILEEAGALGEEILVCTGCDFADSLSASAVGKPILLVKGDTGALTPDQEAWLSALGQKSFTIIGGTSAVSQALEDALSRFGPVTRIKGETRYETSIAVARRYFPDPASAVLAYAWNFPDGLCGGPLAHRMGAPLILTATGSTAPAENYIQSQGIAAGTILGGTQLIDDTAIRTIYHLPADQEIRKR